MGRWHHDGEVAVIQSGLEYVILRPQYFMQMQLQALKVAASTGLLRGASSPSLRRGIVDVRDIAEAAATVLTSGEHNGKTYNLNGPEVVSGPKAASIWGEVLGKKIQYTGHNMDAFEEQMRTKAPSWSAFDIRMMFEGYLERGFVAEDGDVETLTRLLGHAPRRYEDFARETFLQWQEMSKAA